MSYSTIGMMRQGSVVGNDLGDTHVVVNHQVREAVAVCEHDLAVEVFDVLLRLAGECPPISDLWIIAINSRRGI